MTSSIAPATSRGADLVVEPATAVDWLLVATAERPDAPALRARDGRPRAAPPACGRGA